MISVFFLNNHYRSAQDCQAANKIADFHLSTRNRLVYQSVVQILVANLELAETSVAEP